MARLCPVAAAQLSEVAAFLTERFHPKPADNFVKLDYLRWQYLDWPPAPGPRAHSCLEGDNIIAHAGTIYSRFLHPAAEPGAGPVLSNVHSWASSRQAGPAGAMLLWQSFRHSDVQYAFSFSPQAQRVFAAAGFKFVQVVPTFRRILTATGRRAAYSREPLAKSVAFRAIETVLSPWRALPPVSSALALEEVEEFDSNAEQVARCASRHCILSARDSSFLNHILKHPFGMTHGYYLRDGSDLAGLALLHVEEREGVRYAKILDCLMISPDRWQYARAVAPLLRQLSALHADIVIVHAGTPWLQAALRANNFYNRGRKTLWVRDPKAILPKGYPYHMSLLDSDLAFL